MFRILTILLVIYGTSGEIIKFSDDLTIDYYWMYHAKLNDMITFDCPLERLQNFTLNDNDEIVWHHPSKEVSYDEFKIRFYSNGTTLTIASVQLVDSGIFTCTLGENFTAKIFFNIGVDPIHSISQINKRNGKIAAIVSAITLLALVAAVFCYSIIIEPKILDNENQKIRKDSIIVIANDDERQEDENDVLDEKFLQEFMQDEYQIPGGYSQPQIIPMDVVERIFDDDDFDENEIIEKERRRHKKRRDKKKQRRESKKLSRTYESFPEHIRPQDSIDYYNFRQQTEI
ncbi:hypothetical protein SNEBB_007264 [Seison nebaliae]|nr:hypothetical protein SNEBB_007264 [Seison nebaliae]